MTVILYSQDRNGKIGVWTFNDVREDSPLANLSAIWGRGYDKPYIPSTSVLIIY